MTDRVAFVKVTFTVNPKVYFVFTHMLGYVYTVQFKCHPQQSTVCEYCKCANHAYTICSSCT